MTQRRFPHYLRPLGSGKWPQAIICVDAVGVTQQTQDASPTRIELLQSWNATLLIKHGDTYTDRAESCGTTAKEWWAQLAYCLRYTQSTWIVCYRACRVWALLGLWEAIENGTALLVETRSESEMRQVRDDVSGSTIGDQSRQGRARDNVQRLLERASGYLVADDPPNIIRARIANQARWWQWVDLRNYGVECSASTLHGSQMVDEISAAIRSIAFTLHTYKMGGLRATAGAQALAGFRTGYYNGGIYCHNDLGSLALESRGYYGGRCEVTHIGVCEGAVTHLDFRSLYPSVCASQTVPVRLIRCFHQPNETAIATDNPGIGAIAEVDIETDEPAYPYRRPTNAALKASNPRCADYVPQSHYDTDIIYPIGRFRTVLAGHELHDAINHGRVCRVHQLALYELEPALRGYANAMHDMRSAAESRSDVVVAQLAKQLSVCLPGKFGQRLRIWEYAPDIIALVPYGEWWGADKSGRSVRYRSIGWTAWRDIVVGWGQEAVPAIAAWITSAGRMALLGAIRCAGWDNVYYYDTDSLFVNKVGYDRLVAENRIAHRTLGSLQYKGQSYYASFNGIKDYSFGNSVRSAGAPKGFYADAGDGQHFWYDTSPSADIKKGRTPDGRAILGRYYRDGEYRHGVVHDDGRVTPFVLEEW